MRKIFISAFSVVFGIGVFWVCIGIHAYVAAFFYLLNFLAVTVLTIIGFIQIVDFNKYFDANTQSLTYNDQLQSCIYNDPIKFPENKRFANQKVTIPITREFFKNEFNRASSWFIVEAAVLYLPFIVFLFFVVKESCHYC